MKRFFNILSLSKEAILLDSRLYIVKAVFAIAVGYMVGKSLPIARLDMISVLLGVMYNLEPINIIGVRSGINQLVASALGAACTGVLIFLFGINIFTIAFSMALTLLVSIKINWRMVSPVAIFTCIYMTQFVQLNPEGVPSIWLTFRLRIAALGVGVVIAIAFNFLFSFLYYRKIAYKRMEFARIQLINGLIYTEKQLKQNYKNRSRDYISVFPSIFNDLDLVYSNIATMIKESKYSFRGLQGEKLLRMQKILQYFRDINHLVYDINFILCSIDSGASTDEKAVTLIKEASARLERISFTDNGSTLSGTEDLSYESDGECKSNNRIDYNISSVNRYINLINEEVAKL